MSYKLFKCVKCGTDETTMYKTYVDIDTYKRENVCDECCHKNKYNNVIDDKYVKSNVFDIVLKEIENNNPRILRKEIEGTYVIIFTKDQEIIKRAKIYNV